MFNQQASELNPELTMQAETVHAHSHAHSHAHPALPNDLENPGEGQITELSESDLDDVAGGFSLGDLGSFFQESSSFFSETNIFFEQTSFAGRDGAGGKTTFILQAIDSGNTERAGAFGPGAGGCA